MKLKLMIALVILALVFGMTFTACDDGEAPEIKEATKDGTKTETIYDISLLGTYDDDTKSDNYGKYKSFEPDTTKNRENPNGGYDSPFPSIPF